MFNSNQEDENENEAKNKDHKENYFRKDFQIHLTYKYQYSHNDNKLLLWFL